MELKLAVPAYAVPGRTGCLRGSRGVHQPFRVDDANMGIPMKTLPDIYGRQILMPFLLTQTLAQFENVLSRAFLL